MTRHRVLLAIGAFCFFSLSCSRDRARQDHTSVAYVGAAACATCHASQMSEWRQSHHALAMQPADTSTVLADFSDVRVKFNGADFRFFTRDGRFMVETGGPEGETAAYPIDWTFGVTPLQQYLIAFPGGRYQALTIAWDSRTAADGGQRWFDLFPGAGVAPDDAMHWTGRYQNWNMQCAECHSTNLWKHYDAATDAYRTTFSEVNVACEACHGPGSRHVEWAKGYDRAGGDASARGEAAGDTPDMAARGFDVSLASRWDLAWSRTDGAPNAARDTRARDAVSGVCAPCHARRATLFDGPPQAGAALDVSHRLSLPMPPLYHADGQQREEVYTWGSFLQSKMHTAGVTCMDCHDPHTARVRLEGNALCARCHDVPVYDTPTHHHHAAGSAGAECVSCHMPAQNYMQIDARRDHSIRVPRPDVAHAVGAPDACTMCHTDRSAPWAAAAMDRWYGTAWREREAFGATLAGAAADGLASVPPLLELAGKPAAPDVLRAAAIAGVAMFPAGATVSTASSLLRDDNPTVRIAALQVMEALPASERIRLVAPLLSDSIAGVRIEAARVLADVREGQLAESLRDARARALDEYIASLKQNADWPTAQSSIGNLYRQLGRHVEAEAAYRRAITLDPRWAPARVNLADCLRELGRDAEGVAVLEAGLAFAPDDADLLHSLGLSRVRSGDPAAAMPLLRSASEAAPDNVRYAYVYAIALSSSGDADAALDILRDVNLRHPNQPDVLAALASMLREAGEAEESARYMKGIEELQRAVQ